MSSSTNIIPKDCSYQCDTRIYWNTSEKCIEVFMMKMYVYDNRATTNFIDLCVDHKTI